MTSTIPVIISRSAVFFPNTSKGLDLGRVFSVNAAHIAINEFDGQVFVVTQRREEDENPDSLDELMEVGCLCSLEILEVNPDKSLKVKLEGITRAKLLNIAPALRSDNENEYFWIGEIAVLKTKVHSKVKCKQMLLDFLDTKPKIFNFDSPEMMEIQKSLKAADADIAGCVDKLSELWPKDNMNSFELKGKLLCELSLIERIKLLTSATFITDDEKKALNDKIARKVTKNIARQQKEFYLKEKLRVIKEELGDTSSKEVEIAKFKEKLEKESYPEKVKTRANDEIQRLEMCSSYSSEATVIRTYLDWLLNLPWNKMSEDELDLANVRKTLDENHDGLEKIKDRILEFIAVRKKSKENKGSIICFVGPPGVGKTSLAQSIAQALKKEFVKISLGGLYDESELRGHRRTYVASMPGRIIRSMKQAKVNNPVLLLDEVDKLASSYHGDPVSALLEILDPKQNNKFNDHYLEEDFDLSKIMFIATANYEENIPDPLLDRMEMIYLRSYTEFEKFQIAQSHLIQEVLKEHGLTSEELSFSDEAIHFIIQRYTKEAGVRNLKQNLSKIARKFVKRQLLNEIQKEVIGVEEVKFYLEYELFDFTKRDEDSIPGVVNGMAYTDCGGDLLPIEVNHMSGKGNLSLTGNLKDTMRESASVALAYVRANEELFSLKEKEVDWNNIDINLHVPSGGVPKDGPSAGVTITTALISSFSGKSVSSRVAMTGEITLRGKVLPIGGLKEKVVSAVRGGIDTIFYPEENTRNLVDIPEDIREKITLIPVRHYQEIYNKLFLEN